MYSRGLGAWTVGVLAACGPVVGCGPIVGDASDEATSVAETSGTSPSPSTSTTVSSTTSSDPSTTIGETTVPPGDATSVGDESTSTTDDSPFIIPLDGGHPRECDIWAQDCPRGETCMPWANDGGGAWNATRCSPIDPNPKDVGEPCTVVESGVSGIDDCVLGAMCWDVDPETNMGECVAFCQGDEANPTCADACSQCHLTGEGVLILCLPTCDPIAQDCNEGNGCYGVSDTFACAPDASGEVGAIGDACEFINVCDPGNFCANAESVPGCEGGIGCCAPFCDADAADGCDALLPGTSCVPWYEEGQAPETCSSAGTIGGCLVMP